MGSPPRDLSESEALALSEVLRAAGDTAGFGVTVVTCDEEPPQLLYASEAAFDILGLSKPADQQHRTWNFLDSAAWGENQRADSTQQGTSRTFETSVTRQDGSQVPLEVFVYFTDYLGRRVIVSYFSDISQRKATIAALADSEARFRTLIDGAPDGIAIIDKGCFAFVNPAAVRLLGAKSASEVVGKPLGTLLEPADADRADQRIRRILHDQKRLADPAEYKSRRADGQDIYVEVSSIPIQWRGQPAVLGFARDVTERKAMHARLLHKDRLSAVGTLSAGLAHEVNNPLSYVLLSLQFIERELNRLLGPRDGWQTLSDRLEDAVHGAERVAAIVRDLKAFSRTDNGMYEPVDLARVVESAIRVAYNTVRHNAKLVRDIRPVHAVLCSPQRIEQVVLNLLINAAQALANGDSTKDTITVRVFEENDEAVLIVKDTGPGMAAHDLQRVFEPFFTTKPAGIGTGLGLPICRNIVQAAGGSISVDSELGKGAEFKVRLPITHEPASYPPPPSANQTSESAGQPRVLLVDATRQPSQTHVAFLSARCQVLVTADLAEALTVLEQDRAFDVLVCDAVPRGSELRTLSLILDSYETLADRSVVLTETPSTEPLPSLELANTRHRVRELPKPLGLREVHELLLELAAPPSG